MPVLTFVELKASLQAVQEPVPNYQAYIFNAFTTLFETGCRPNEIFDINRWTVQSNDIIRLQPSKKNLPRYFPIAQLPLEFVHQIETGEQLYYPYSIRRLRYHFNQFYMPAGTFVQGKDIELYLFRHYYIKELDNQGFNADEIAQKMGYTTTTVVSGYINSVIQF